MNVKDTSIAGLIFGLFAFMLALAVLTLWMLGWNPDYY